MASQVRHLCAPPAAPVGEQDAVIQYNPKFDEYGIKVLDGGSSVINITHCPFCGRSLPESLRDQWFEELSALGITDPLMQPIPPEYATDEWQKGARRYPRFKESGVSIQPSNLAVAAEISALKYILNWVPIQEDLCEDPRPEILAQIQVLESNMDLEAIDAEWGGLTSNKPSLRLAAAAEFAFRWRAGTRRNVPSILWRAMAVNPSSQP